MTVRRTARRGAASRLPPVAEAVSADGTRLPLRGLPGDPGSPVVVILPAMGVSARFYLPLVRALHGAGLGAVTTDLRGHGESTPPVSRGSRFGYREMAGADLTAVFAAVADRFPSAPVVVLGHSLGGQLALLHLARHYPAASGGPRISGVILVASGSAWHGGFAGWHGPRNLVVSQLFGLTARVIGYWPGDLLGFGGRQSRGVMRDWARQARTGRYLLPGGGDYESALRALRLPVLAIDVEGDDLAPPGAVSHLCGKIPNARLRRRSYARADADGRYLGHFRWVRYHQGLVPVLSEWIGQLSSPVEGLTESGT
ncbi:MAG: alpha/beta fold hydrolase [Nocardiopsaceae bacterium]|nr:alpha/beta fold hydrolase [Nocardiopsaceae bacterium]